jgi:energy-coupling factor transporter transmembrane protein EcfT
MLASLLVGLSFIESLLLIPFVFYALIVVLVVVSIVLIDESPGNKREGWFFATLLSALLVALVCWKTGVHWTDLRDHPLYTALGFVAYVGVGTLWSFGKWYFFLSKVKEKYLEIKQNFISRNNLPPSYPDISEATRDSHTEYERVKDKGRWFIRALQSELHLYKDVDEDSLHLDPAQVTAAVKPQASAHKSSITRWIMCWPLSFAWTMLNDPLRKIADSIFNHLRSVFQRMSDKMFHGI